MDFNEAINEAYGNRFAAIFSNAVVEIIEHVLKNASDATCRYEL